jgi:hypothetical protein
MPGLEIAELAKMVGPGWNKSGLMPVMVTLSYLLYIYSINESETCLSQIKLKEVFIVIESIF